MVLNCGQSYNIYRMGLKSTTWWSGIRNTLTWVQTNGSMLARPCGHTTSFWWWAPCVTNMDMVVTISDAVIYVGWWWPTMWVTMKDIFIYKRCTFNLVWSRQSVTCGRWDGWRVCFQSSMGHCHVNGWPLHCLRMFAILLLLLLLLLLLSFSKCFE
jgi:hypothetical protein